MVSSVAIGKIFIARRRIMDSGGKLKIAADGEGVQQVLMRCRSTKSPRYSAPWKKPSPRIERNHLHLTTTFPAISRLSCRSTCGRWGGRRRRCDPGRRPPYRFFGGGGRLWPCRGSGNRFRACPSRITPAWDRRGRACRECRHGGAVGGRAGRRRYCPCRAHPAHHHGQC